MRATTSRYRGCGVVVGRHEPEQEWGGRVVQRREAEGFDQVICRFTAVIEPTSGNAWSEPTENRADHRLVVEVVAHHEATDGPHSVPSCSQRRAGALILQTTRLLVQEVRAA
jgi:hypothetical protein